jgi:hypothetical protein
MIEFLVTCPQLRPESVLAPYSLVFLLTTSNDSRATCIAADMPC